MQPQRAPRAQFPAGWSSQDRDRDDSADSTVDAHGSIQFDEESEQHQRSRWDAGHVNPYAVYGLEGQTLQRRRSSVGIAMRAMREAGGVNSLENFARSWQRAAGFHEVAPVRRGFRYADDDDDGGDDNAAPGEDGSEHAEGELHPSASRRPWNNDGDLSILDHALDDSDGWASPARLSRTTSKADQSQAMSDQQTREQEPLLRQIPSRRSKSREDKILRVEPSLNSLFGGSYGSTWGSLTSRVNESSMRHAGRLFRQQQMPGTSVLSKDHEPLLVKRVEEDDGTVVNVVIGQSTLPQTIFNSINVLIGVGLLALPLAMRYAGWIPGLIFFSFAGASTCYTAKLLAKCADIDGSLITFADLAYVSFGPWARILTSTLFSLELIGACVALVVLFADSLDSLVPGWGVNQWKVACGIILLPLVFVPLRFLSFSSIIGILACFGIVLAVLIDGLIKPDRPGSLREPAATHLFPENWRTLPIALGILMSPWGGHSVFPNIYRDMRHPYRYSKGVDITYMFTFALDLLMAIVGLLMFGDGVQAVITGNILSLDGYPRWMSILIVICVAIIPLTKVPLNARPIVSTLELFLGLDRRAMGDAAATHGMSGLSRGLLRVAVRIVSIIVFVVLAIAVPQFDTIMSLLGAVACFTICLILPCAFHLKLFQKDLTAKQKAIDWILIVISTCLAIVCTGFNMLPRSTLGL